MLRNAGSASEMLLEYRKRIQACELMDRDRTVVRLMLRDKPYGVPRLPPFRCLRPT